ncbi:MAG: hypothetical protein H8E26_04600 [FCB group bacterium]|nr:hypothetical protein [FCB group bacterium]MBL7028339.1 hypothetical protein [Candidatus Neomarinimicrobiota bacterium]MBL7121658.1 hypothetical protein [Candidatus Neomarinimicrobiota bacterium]
MKAAIFIAHLILAGAVLFSCESKEIEIPASITETYDSLKAMEYGADDYGMRKYVIAFLKKGPNRDLSPEKAKELQAAHLKNIGAMADAGKLALAGPFYGSGELRGLYFFNVESLEEAEALTNSDPAIQAGSLEMELKEWYGSAALMAVGDIHKTLAKIDI